MYRVEKARFLWQYTSFVLANQSLVPSLLHKRMATNESDKQSKKQKLRNSRRCLTVGTWDVHTLVESVGDECICRKVNKPGNHRNDHGMVDRKLDLLARELKRYGVSIAGIQETKWFGNDVWPADGYTFLHSGRPLPSDQERAARNEGVGIALDKKATAAWKNAGEVWEASVRE